MSENNLIFMQAMSKQINIYARVTEREYNNHPGSKQQDLTLLGAVKKF